MMSLPGPTDLGCMLSMIALRAAWGRPSNSRLLERARSGGFGVTGWRWCVLKQSEFGKQVRDNQPPPLLLFYSVSNPPMIFLTLADFL